MPSCNWQDWHPIRRERSPSQISLPAEPEGSPAPLGDVASQPPGDVAPAVGMEVEAAGTPDVPDVNADLSKVYEEMFPTPLSVQNGGTEEQSLGQDSKMAHTGLLPDSQPVFESIPTQDLLIPKSFMVFTKHVDFHVVCL